MIFIFGAQGFVGSAFVRYCERNQLEYVPIVRKNYDDLIGQHCDLFVNAAGNSFKRLALTDPMQDFNSNVNDTLRSLLDFPTSKYVYLSTIDVYNDCSNPANNAETVSIRTSQLSRYGLNKYVGEQLVRKYALEHLIIRLGGMVGPRLRKNAIFDITQGDRLFVHPQSAYQYLHTDYVARLVIQLSSISSSDPVYNLCGDGIVFLSDLLQILGSTTEETYLPIERYDINIAKIKSVLHVPSSLASVLKYLDEIGHNTQVWGSGRTAQ